MEKGHLALQPVDRVEITSLMDNYVDSLLASEEGIKRPPVSYSNGEMRPTLLAEHGFSVLIKTFSGNESHTILMDAAMSVKGLLHNLEHLEIDMRLVEAVVLSHGHFDHRAALSEVLARIGREGLPVHLHPDAFLNRRIIFPDRSLFIMPPFLEESLEAVGARAVRTKAPQLLAGDTVGLTGEVDRENDFEKGFPIHYAERDGEIVPDPWIWDDQALLVHVRGKGLVVITGCGHSGIVNTLGYARTLTGIREVHAVMGGFHLTGGLFEPIIPPTVKSLSELGPRWMIPTHCTGWKATKAFQNHFEESFIQNSVGTVYQF